MEAGADAERVVLVALTEAEFPAWLRTATAWYEADMIRHGLIGETDAGEKAAADMAAQLSGGVNTPGHTLAHVVDAGSGERIGWVWYRRIERRSGRVTFIYQIEIVPGHRGRGFGRAAMLAIERASREAGAGAVELNVFAGNAVARALYRSLGFAESALSMRKLLQ